MNDDQVTPPPSSGSAAANDDGPVIVDETGEKNNNNELVTRRSSQDHVSDLLRSAYQYFKHFIAPHQPQYLIRDTRVSESRLLNEMCLRVCKMHDDGLCYTHAFRLHMAQYANIHLSLQDVRQAFEDFLVAQIDDYRDVIHQMIFNAGCGGFHLNIDTSALSAQDLMTLMQPLMSQMFDKRQYNNDLFHATHDHSLMGNYTHSRLQSAMFLRRHEIPDGANFLASHYDLLVGDQDTLAFAIHANVSQIHLPPYSLHNINNNDSGIQSENTTTTTSHHNVSDSLLMPPPPSPLPLLQPQPLQNQVPSMSADKNNNNDDDDVVVDEAAAALKINNHSSGSRGGDTTIHIFLIIT